MSTLLDDILNEADSLIEKNASKNKEPAVKEFSEVEKMAEMLMNSEEDIYSNAVEKTASPKEVVETPFEKIAHAVAVLETAVNLNKMKKVAEFKKVAMENGNSEESVDHFISEKGMLPIHEYINMEDFL